MKTPLEIAYPDVFDDLPAPTAQRVREAEAEGREHYKQGAQVLGIVFVMAALGTTITAVMTNHDYEEAKREAAWWDNIPTGNPNRHRRLERERKKKALRASLPRYNPDLWEWKAPLKAEPPSPIVGPDGARWGKTPDGRWVRLWHKGAVDPTTPTRLPPR